MLAGRAACWNEGVRMRKGLADGFMLARVILVVFTDGVECECWR